MCMSKVYHLFVSHSWNYSNAYKNLINLLDSDKSFKYCNYSVPKDDPVHDAKNDKELYEAIKAQVKYASVVVILAGVYASYKEIHIANYEFSSKKPILAIEPWDSERTSKLVKDNADKIVKWQTSSIISAIKELAQ